MILKRIATHFRQQDWFTVVVELLVVVAGLLLAFQVDRWRDFREDRQLEATYIDRLIRDFVDRTHIRRPLLHGKHESDY